MILAIDIGNTNIVTGCIKDGKILFRERLSTNHTATKLEYSAIFKTAFDMYGINSGEIDGAIISSVVPSVTSVVKDSIETLFGTQVMVVGPGIKTGISIVIDNPAQLGSDLVVDAVAGVSEYSVPQIIIDMGTATTITAIDREKRFLGGAIMPGVRVSHDALIDRTSQLPKIALEKPKKVIGSNTIDCIKSGIIYGNAGAIDGIIDRYREELGEDCTVIATGGLAKVIAPLCKNEIIIDEDLLLKGLMLIYEKNKCG
ncbi:MAG: type III pantothenate kinase [Clostridia bacterium]|nr:type III pantothenate kinase [Clostridia bacterium]MBR2886139.1 type III pantothenate kinase [Clostridia bacterium]